MRLHLFTLDENEAMRLREMGWKFRRLEGSEWELVWPNTKLAWPNDPDGYFSKEKKS